MPYILYRFVLLLQKVQKYSEECSLYEVYFVPLHPIFKHHRHETAKNAPGKSPADSRS